MLHWASRCEDQELREQMVSLLNSKGADKSAKDLVTYGKSIIGFHILKCFQSGNLPEFYLDNEFPATKVTETENKDVVSNGPVNGEAVDNTEETKEATETNNNANTDEESKVMCLLLNREREREFI